jgi:hypothetical protein
MVAAVHDVTGQITGIHRTWLALDGSRKAKVEPCRMSLGTTRGAAVRFAKPAATLAIGEGIETMLAVRAACPSLAVWAALSTSGLRTIELPGCVRTVILAEDNDPPGKQAAIAAALRLTRQGRTVKLARPPLIGADFNDMAIAEAEAR